MKSPMKICMSMLLCSSLSLFFNSCTKDVTHKDSGKDVATDALSRIREMGFNTTGVKKVTGGYVVEGDIFLADKDIERSPKSPTLRIAKTEQYSTFKLITVGASRVITISVSSSLPAVYAAAADEAIARYNALGMRLSFTRVGSGGQIDIQNGNLGAGVLGQSAGFPDINGNPPSPIVLSAANIGSSPDQSYLATLIAHEIGHCIGLRHTDYFNRNYSCNYSNNESAGDDGAVNIPGTPTAEDPNSWMLACLGSGINRPFNANDILALNYLYGGNPPATITSAPQAMVFRTNPNNQIEIYAIGANNNVIHKWYTIVNGQWSAWQDLGGYVAYPPYASTKDGNTIDLFAVGGGNILYYRNYDKGAWNNNTGGWTAWTGLGGAFKSQPYAISRDASNIDFFAIGTDNQLHQWWFNTSSGWAAQRILGPYNLKYSPVAVCKDGNTLDVFATGQDNALYHVYWSNGTWSGMEYFGGSLTSAPVAVVKDQVSVDVFARGASNQLMHKWYSTSAGWSAWEDFGGTLASAPCVLSKNSQSVSVFAQGPNNNLLYKWYSPASGWSTWEDLGGYITSQPSAVSADGSTIDVFAKGASNNLVHRRWNGSWSAWETIY